MSVAGLQAGDVLEYHTVTHVTTPLAPHEFWYEHSFSKEAAVHEGRLQIDIPKARTVKLKSPDHKYETKDSGDRRIYTWTVTDFVPDRKHERDAILEAPDYTPDVQLSTFADWQQVGQWYAKLQGDRVTVDESVRKKAVEQKPNAALEGRAALPRSGLNIRYVSICLAWVDCSLTPHRKCCRTATEIARTSTRCCSRC